MLKLSNLVLFEHIFNYLGDKLGEEYFLRRQMSLPLMHPWKFCLEQENKPKDWWSTTQKTKKKTKKWFLRCPLRRTHYGPEKNKKGSKYKIQTQKCSKKCDTKPFLVQHSKNLLVLKISWNHFWMFKLLEKWIITKKVLDWTKNYVVWSHFWIFCILFCFVCFFCFSVWFLKPMLLLWRTFDSSL